MWEKTLDTTHTKTTLTDFEAITEKTPFKGAHETRFLLNWIEMSSIENFSQNYHLLNEKVSKNKFFSRYSMYSFVTNFPSHIVHFLKDMGYLLSHF
jgi:hypothetical protein